MPGLSSPASESTLSAPADAAYKPRPEARPVAPDDPTAPQAIDLRAYPIQWRRYGRTLWYAGWLFARIIFWEIIMRRAAGEATASYRVKRRRAWAREFRELAVNMGGVMIKLGQFISVRVDILPPEVTSELASLQDEVPTVPFSAIRRRLEDELGPLSERFAVFDETPIAAASLGQVHRARLPDGERVVVKVQRPGIHSMVATDLRALGVTARGLMRFRFVARRADIPALLDEFSAGLWQELDYEHEADNAEAFARLFADNMGVYVPAVHRPHSTCRVLTLEDVTTIKVTDYDRIEAAGISRQDVARRLVSTYLDMVFNERFFHGDPHPGNLFVYPLPPDIPAPMGRHADGRTLQGRPFYLIFVDFGLVGHVTPEIVAGLRETLIALIQRDAARVVRSYEQLGVLLPGADLERILAATQSAFDRMWGLNLAQLGEMPLSEIAHMGREFNDLLFAMPFQVPQDFLYLSRAVGLLVGICTALDPTFNPWREIAPFVRRLLQQDGELPGFDGRGLGPRDLLRILAGNSGLDRLLPRNAPPSPEPPERTVRAALSPELERELRRIEAQLWRVTRAIVFAALLISTTLLYTAEATVLSAIGLVLTAAALARLLFSGPRRPRDEF